MSVPVEMPGPSGLGRHSKIPNSNTGGRSTGMHCMAPGCSNNHRKNPEVHFHRLPWRHQLVVQQWLARMKLARPPKLQYARVCSQHFVEDDYELKGHFDESRRFHLKRTTKLKPLAVPSLFDFSGYSKGATDAPTTFTKPEVKSDRAKRHSKRLQQQQKQLALLEVYQVKSSLISCVESAYGLFFIDIFI